MLYDPKWEAPQIKADPFKIETIVAWLENQPADKIYNYFNCGGMCLYGQYMAAQGIEWKESGHFDPKGDRADFCCFIYRAVAVEEPWTFGAALERARKAAGH